MRIWAIRVAALAILLLLALLASLGSRTLARLPDTVVYFVRSDDTTFTLAPAYRRTATEDPEAHARAAIAALTEGPRPEERTLGLTTALPAELDVRSVDVTNGILHVDFSGDLEDGGGTALMRARLEQLFYTLTQPREIDGVELSIEGSPLHVFSGEGILVDRPWYRAEHTELPRW
jgi:spore germination protein GerM